MKKRLLYTLIVGLCLIANFGFCQSDGLLYKDGVALFPIGFYEHPQDVEQLRRMAEAGVNLVHCRDMDDLDRADSVGMMGVVPLPLQAGATEDLRQTVETMREHPALAVWEGPDEIVWTFTAASMLHREQGIHKQPGEWRLQTENALEYAKSQAAKIIPNMRAAAEMIREMDTRKRPIWMNEAVESDLLYVREYLPFIDIVGCDIYPVKKDSRRVHRMGPATDRWVQVGRGKPVWMVLQAFAWSELGEYYGVKEVAYPHFYESRFMAYDVIAHGATGILYWGSAYMKSDPFRESVYALTRELSALQPFLTSAQRPELSLHLVEFPDVDTPQRGVKAIARRFEDEWLVVLINEDDVPHLGVEVGGLEELNGHSLELLYDNETAHIQDGLLLTRMKPYEVKVFATDRRWENANWKGRDFMDGMGG